jgi:hypothetical protein
MPVHPFSFISPSSLTIANDLPNITVDPFQNSDPPSARHCANHARRLA